MKNKNILLDTNAFIYLMRNEKECSNTISLENRQINESKFYDECKNANYLFITSQTLYEIFWQSIKKTKKIDQFAYYYDQIIKFKNKYNVKFSILNDTDGEFELRLFEDQYKDNKVDINHFIERKREYEVKKINELLIKVCFSITEFLAEYYGILLLRNFYYVAGVICEIKLNEISYKYYSDLKLKNEWYDKEIDDLFNFLLENMISYIEPQIKENGHKFPKIQNVKGTKYVHKLFCKLKKDDKTVFEKYDNHLKGLVEELEKMGMSKNCMKYWIRMCRRCVYSGAKIKKNDGLDYSIVTCMDESIVINKTNNMINTNYIIFVTFDTNLYNFSKECDVLYSKKFYDNLMFEYR